MNIQKIRTTIQYNLNNFSIDKENSKLERNFVMRDEDGVLSSKLEISHLNIAEMANYGTINLPSVVEDMNYDDELNVRYYNWEEEQARLNRSILKEAKKRHEKMNILELAEEIYELSGEVIDWQEILYKKAKEELDGELLEQLIEKFPEQFGQDFIKQLVDELPEELKEKLLKQLEKRALKEAEVDKQKEIASKMLEKDFPLETISEISGLSIDKIEKLKN